MEELKKVQRVLARLDPTAPHEVLLVLDASQGQNALAQAQQFHAGRRRHRPRHDQARRHGQGRHRARDRRLAEAADPLHRRRRDGRRISTSSTPAPSSTRCSRRSAPSGRAHDPVRPRLEALPERPRGPQRPLARDRARRDGVPDRPLGRRQEHAAEADRADRAADPRHAASSTARTPRAVPRSKIPAFRRQVGVVFQDHKLLMDRPVYDNVGLPLVIAGVPEKEIEKRVRAALDQVGLLGARAHAADRALDRRAAARRHRARRHRQAARC